MEENKLEIYNTIKKEIEIIKEDFYKVLEEIIEIPSELGEAEEDAPFGKYPKKALEKILEIGTKLGFKGKIVNNAMTYIQYGEGKEYIGIFGHLDVVTAGDGWSTNPYELTLKDGVFYARGILDNKGPILANLFGLYILKRLNILPKTPIRIIFGSNEENGSKDIDLYLQKEKPPVFGYTPDCKYPVVYGERGVVRIKLTTLFENNELDIINKISGEFSSSFIPDKVKIVYKNKEEKIYKGKKSPSNAPEMGNNAILLMARDLKDSDNKLSKYMTWLYDSFSDYEGKNLGIRFEDLDSGVTQVSLTNIKKENNKIEIQFSSRYPVTIKEDELVRNLKNNIPENSQMEIIKSMPSVIFPKDDKRLKLLQDAYEKSTGLDGRPVTTTGATYARKMPNIVAFGPSFPGQKGIAHKENEYMTEEDLLKNLEIYTLALYNLAKDI